MSPAFLLACLTPDSTLKLTIDRDTGDVTLANNTGNNVDLAGVGMLSGNGSWNSGAWTSITTTYDDGGAVSADAWLELARTPGDLSESTLGTGTLAQGQTISLGNALWTQYPDETDISLEYLDANTGETFAGLVEFVDSNSANGSSGFDFGDYNFDGSVNALDWPTQRDNYNADMTGLSVTQSYHQGDLNGDGDNDLGDQLAFKALFEAANGAGSFAALTGATVPEPSTVALVAIACVLLSGRRLVHSARFAAAALLFLLFLPVADVCAQSSISINFHGNGGAVAGPAGVTGSSNWNNFASNVGTASEELPELIDQSGAPTGAGVTWSSNTTWSNGPAGTENEKLLQGYLDDNGAGGMHVQVSGIPAATYDVTVFFNHDGSSGTASLFDIDVNGTNFVTTGAFNQPQAGVIDTGNSLTVTGLFGTLNLDSGQRTNPGISNISGIEIVASSFVDTAITLEVDASNGNAQIRNTNALNEAVNIDFFEITSTAGNHLNESGWSPLGTGTNDGSDWEELGNLDDSNLAQFFLDGNDSIGPGLTRSLGTAYQTGVGEQPLEFRYHDASSGITRTGHVLFTTIEGLDGDYNNDGIVNAADYTLWRDNLGAADESGINGNGDGGGVTASDYTFWKSNFGNTSGSGSLATAQVPEPSTLALVLATCGGLAFVIRRRKGADLMADKSRKESTNLLRPVMLCMAVTSAVAWAVAGSTALATVTNDREYSFGEDSLEGASQGAIIGSDNTGALVADNSADSKGPTFAFQDLTQSGGPTYQNVGPGGLQRPGATGTVYGARFDGTNNLQGIPLNRPDELKALVDAQLTFPDEFPLDYSSITGRGLQLWVYPDAAAIGSAGSPTTFQSIVSDTTNSGGPAINAAGQWTQINSDHIDIGGTVDVVGDTWYHVMHHNFPVSGNTFKSVLYVDGMAVSANLDGIPLGSTGALVVGATDTGEEGATEHFFTGVVDDLDMYVFDGSFGTFDLFTDNEWIAAELAANHPGVSGSPTAGDVDLDGDVDDDDVTAFISGWRKERSFAGAHSTVFAGDLDTWGWGDSNLDGQVNFSDWFLLRANHPNGASLDLGALLNGAAVPEPSSVALLLLGAVGAGLAIKRRQAA